MPLKTAASSEPIVNGNIKQLLSALRNVLKKVKSCRLDGQGR